MALLAWLFLRGFFLDWLPAEQIDSYIAGLIILAAAPCTAMVFIWSNLSSGEPHFTLTQVALNDVIMIFAFAPIVGLLLGLSAIAVPWDTLFLSVVLYIVIPVLIAQLWRRAVLALVSFAFAVAACFLAAAAFAGYAGLYLAHSTRGAHWLYIHVFSFFAALAAVIACLGLYGLASFSAERRTREIGIRKALGASVSNIASLLSREFVPLIVLANIIAWPVAYFAMDSWMRDFAYRIHLGIEIFAHSSKRRPR